MPGYLDSAQRRLCDQASEEGAAAKEDSAQHGLQADLENIRDAVGRISRRSRGRLSSSGLVAGSDGGVPKLSSDHDAGSAFHLKQPAILLSLYPSLFSLSLSLSFLLPLLSSLCIYVSVCLSACRSGWLSVYLFVYRSLSI